MKVPRSQSHHPHCIVWAIFFFFRLCRCGHFSLHPPGTIHLHAALSKRYQNPLGTSLVKNINIDEDLYSRQLLVHGKTSQQNLLQSHVTVIGDGPVAREVAKNLALAGIGALTLVYSQRAEMKGGGHSLASFVKNLNPRVQVSRCESLADVSTGECSAVVLTDMPLEEAKVLNEHLRYRGIKTVFCRVYGVCGVVFADVVDSVQNLNPLGLLQPEGILSAGDVITGEEGEPLLRVNCVEEEALTVQEADKVTLIYNNTSVGLEVLKIVDGRTAILKVDDTRIFSDKVKMFEDIIRSIGNTETVVMRQTGTLLKRFKHMSLADSWSSLKDVVPSNSCDDSVASRMKDRTFLRLIEKAERMYSSEGSDDNVNSFIEQTVWGSTGIRDITKIIIELKTIWNGLARSAVQNSTNTMAAKRRGSFLQCPATVSVMGAIAAQEVVKACSGAYAPLSQIFSFQSVGSLSCLDSSSETPQLEEGSGDSRLNGATTLVKGGRGVAITSATETELLYGSVAAEELPQLRVLVVGVGAIGCEVLKVLQQLSVGSNSSKGSVTIVDPDHIERSNLNRQLFFRERHIGQPKATVAASYLRNISKGEFSVTPLTIALTSDTEHVLPPNFWNNLDVVITALDSTEARIYVDKKCVDHGTWMIDAGTVGLKGSTQVVVPFASESYSSLENIPDKAIPVCTLKTFPYKAEHCVAWAKGLFEVMFISDVALLQKLLAQVALDTADDGGGGGVASLLSSEMLLEEGVARRLLNQLLWPHIGPLLSDILPARSPVGVEGVIQGALLQSLVTFEEQFVQDMSTLLSEHPIDSLEDNDFNQKTLFWGKNRRYPRVIRFNKLELFHREFMLHAARILCRSRGLSVSLDEVGRVFDSSIDALSEMIRKSRSVDLLSVLQSHSNHSSSRPFSPHPSEHYLSLLRETLRDGSVTAHGGRIISLPFRDLQKTPINITTEEFQKDSKDAGHVDFCSAATNIRASCYHLPAVDRIIVQKYAGNIIPALATTTALVSGLVGLELLKVATEKSALRRRRVDEKILLSNFHQPQLRAKWSKLRRLLPFRNRWLDLSTSSANSLHERERVLGRFRNSFVDLDGPVVSHAEPAAAEETHVVFGGAASSFTLWDRLQIPGKTIHTLSIKDLKVFLSDQFGVNLISVVWEDVLLYADFLPAFVNNKRDDATVHELLKDTQMSGSVVGGGAFEWNEAVELKLHCENSTTGHDVLLPRLRLSSG